MPTASFCFSCDFNPRAPRGARLEAPVAPYPRLMISIHALREERDLVAGPDILLDGLISIHALREERDLTPSPLASRSVNFNPRAPRGARPGPAQQPRRHRGISIHALREERDNPPLSLKASRRLISIHALREERDGGFLWLPARPRDFNPRAPRGARHYEQCGRAPRGAISIHALREERDSKKTQNRRAFFVINIKYYESFR